MVKSIINTSILNMNPFWSILGNFINFLHFKSNVLGMKLFFNLINTILFLRKSCQGGAPPTQQLRVVRYDEIVGIQYSQVREGVKSCKIPRLGLQSIFMIFRRLNIILVVGQTLKTPSRHPPDTCLDTSLLDLS